MLEGACVQFREVVVGEGRAEVVLDERAWGMFVSRPEALHGVRPWPEALDRG